MKKTKMVAILALAFTFSVAQAIYSVISSNNASAIDAGTTNKFAFDASTLFQGDFSNILGIVLPILIGIICVAGMALGQKLFSHRKTPCAVDIETEIAEEIAEIIDSPEEAEDPTIDHFVAEPISRPQPKITPVDTFIRPQQ